MKLNLLPTHVSKEKAVRGALIGSILIFALLFGASVLLFLKGKSDYADSLNGIAEAEGKAQRARETADYADTVMQQSKTLLRNTDLAQKMLAHNDAYPKLYDMVKRYIPSFYRVNSMSAAANGPGSSTVTLVGVLDTYQQYADLMLALLRIPGIQSVSRDGFNNNAMYVPAPTPEDQAGKPHKPGEAPIPDDPAKRLDYFLAQGRVTGYQGVSGFGSGQPGPKGPMPNSSQVTVTIVLATDLQSPDPRATLAAGGADTATGSTGPAASGGNLPPTTTAPPTTAPTDTPPARKGKKGSVTDEE